MAQKFDYLKAEAELRMIIDELYNISKTAMKEGKRPSIKGLVEIISSETTIVTAIHNIKSNKGSKTQVLTTRQCKKII
jgi:RNA-directed DNA polymerase